ncbi:tRNA-splicing endonuclease subunit, variant 2 [Orbilia oligospora]|nr:tRNA-splicing endonuclease subunit, variant 2 [Orbilia oligospora]KAF3208974.1 tRNA-splicing endonuclease subunit, variant 2 [Orbilia oligospora]KAF3234881.1 tRNA-splicing endonuclease subunit, variant 2 [Orbilia oligospora]
MGDDASKPCICINHVAGRYLVYDVNDIAYLRISWHMCGTLFGTLPQAQQQNIFLGLPLELMREEARLLVDQRVATIVEDSLAHRDAVKALSETDRADILSLKTQEQDKLMLANREESMKRKEAAIENAKASGKWKTKPARSSEPSIDKSKETLLFESTLDAIVDGVGDEGGREELASTAQRTSADDGSQRQYVIPMASSAIGLHSLRLPREAENIPSPPDARYQVYKYLQSLGYFMSPGLRFGCQFVAYPGDPLRFHSHFLVKSLQWDEELSILDLVGGGRLGTGVKKAWMMAGLEQRDIEADTPESHGVRTFCVEWAGFG